MTRISKEHRDIEYLSHALDCIEKITETFGDSNPEELLLKLVVLGEVFYNYGGTNSKLSDDLGKKFSSIAAFDRIAKIRNSIVHPLQPISAIEKSVIKHIVSDKKDFEEIRNYIKTSLNDYVANCLKSYLEIMDQPNFTRSQLKKIQGVLEKCDMRFGCSKLKVAYDCSRELWDIFTEESNEKSQKSKELITKITDFIGTISLEVQEIRSDHKYFSHTFDFLNNEKDHEYTSNDFQQKLDSINKLYPHDLPRYRWNVLNMRSMLQHQSEKVGSDFVKSQEWSFIKKCAQGVVHSFTDKAVNTQETFNRLVKECEKVVLLQKKLETNSIAAKLETNSIATKRPINSVSDFSIEGPAKNKIAKHEGGR